MSILYLIILALLVLFSWIGSVYGLVLPDGMLIPNLLGADSVRYFVRHSIEHIAAAPFVEAILLLIMVSAVKQSGLWQYFVEAIRERALPALSRRQSYAMRVSLIVFVVCTLIVAMGLIGPRGNLLSVTGHISGGPFAQGWLPLSCVCVCVPCICYGWLSGVWSTERAVLSALSTSIARYASYFVTLVIASQLMAAIHYLRLSDFFSWGDTALTICAIVVYGLPLLLLLINPSREQHYS